MSKEQFKKLFVDELREIYSAENQIVDALPNMINAAEYPDLKHALSKHLEETRQQVVRLDTIFSQIGEDRGNETSQAMQGLIKTGEKTIQKYPVSILRDAALIAVAQRIEHYEIAVYGTLRTFAKQLDFDEVVDLLDETLEEEKNADEKLTSIAEGGFFTSGVNKKAQKHK